MTKISRETVGDVIVYLSPDLLSEEPVWPPDVFAVAALLLKRSGAYREVANAWPPEGYSDTTAWHEFIAAVATQWRKTCDGETTAVPAQIQEWWDEIVSHVAFPVRRIGDDGSLFVALLGLVAASDQACGGFGFSNKKGPISRKEDRANSNLSTNNSLCEMIHPSRCCVLPKAHNPYAGMTMRSLTHNLALWDRGEVAPAWENIKIDIPSKTMNVLLLPWPSQINPEAFHPADTGYSIAPHTVNKKRRCSCASRLRAAAPTTGKRPNDPANLRSWCYCSCDAFVI